MSRRRTRRPAPGVAFAFDHEVLVERKDLRLGAHSIQRPDRIEKLVEAGATYDEVHTEVDAIILPRLLERHENISALARAMGKSRPTVRKLLVSAGLYPEN